MLGDIIHVKIIYNACKHVHSYSKYGAAEKNSRTMSMGPPAKIKQVQYSLILLEDLQLFNLSQPFPVLL